MIVAAIAFSIVLAKRFSASTDQQMESIQRQNSEMVRLRQNYNESHTADRKSWLVNLHEFKMKLLALES